MRCGAHLSALELCAVKIVCCRVVSETSCASHLSTLELCAVSSFQNAHDSVEIAVLCLPVLVESSS